MSELLTDEEIWNVKKEIDEELEKTNLDDLIIRMQELTEEYQEIEKKRIIIVEEMLHVEGLMNCLIDRIKF